MRIRKINISTRLTLGFSIIIAFSILIGVVSLINISKATQATHNIYVHPLKVGNAVRDINANIIAMHRSMKDIALAETELELNKAERMVSQYEQEVYILFDVVFENFLGDKKDIYLAYNSFSDWKLIREEVIQLWYKGNINEATAITKEKGAEHVEKVLSDVDVMIKFANNKANEFYSETIIRENKASTTMLILLLAAIFISGIIIIVVSRSLIEPINSLNLVAKKIQSGDLSVRNEIKSKDELSKLALVFNSMTDSIESRGKVLTGLTEISKELLGQENSVGFAHSLLSKFIGLTNSQMATFYVLNKYTNSFELLDSIGANVELLKIFDATSPEGDFGNVITKKEIYYLKEISKNTIFRYNSIVGEIIPKEVISLPIIVNSEVVAIISCANINRFSWESKNILMQANPLINASYATLIANLETLEYSQKLEIINQELEMQSEELQEQSEELRQQANELKGKSDELHEQNLEMEVQRRHVEEANRLKSEFLSNMSHELRTPLNSINALSKVLIMQAANKLNDDETNYLTIIERNGKRLLSLINDILDLSKVEAGKMEVFPKSFSLNIALSLMTENLQSLAIDKALELTLNIYEEIEIESDESRLHQVFTNVVGNAIKFTERGKVDIVCEKKDGKAIIRISDTGIGIEKNILPYIFHEFRQGDGTTSRSYEGTGLGLAIARKIIHELNGEILVESRKGIGSIFTIEIPLEWNGEEGLTDIENSISKQLEESKKIILIVDDEQHRMNKISIKLEEEGYNTLQAYSEKEAIELAKEYKPCAIILDITIPEIDSLQILKEVRLIESTRDLPVIVVTTKELNDDDVKFLKDQAAFVLTKGDSIADNMANEIFRILQQFEGDIKNPNQIVNDGKKNVLIIEDNELAVIQVRKVLENEGIFVNHANNGKEALEIIKKNNPDGIILDLMMPGMDGFEVLEEIRRSDLTRNIPVLILTAKSLTKKDLNKLSSNNIQQLIQKGDVDINELISKVNSILEPQKEIRKSINIPTELPVKESELLSVKKNEKPKILIIEDNPDNRITTRAILGNRYNILEAEDGEQGMQIIFEEKPDLILLDILLPKKDGFAVIKEIRENELVKDLPVIALTARAMKNDHEKILEAGCNEYVSKPIDDIDLLGKINRFLHD